MSSLRTSSVRDDLSGRSSASLSLEQQLVNDFHLRASVDSSSVSDGGSPPPPPMHMLSLSSPIPWQHPSHETSSDNTVESPSLLSRRQVDPSQTVSLSLPPQPRHPQGFKPSGPPSPYELPLYEHPPSPGVAPKSAINPIFKVVSTICAVSNLTVLIVRHSTLATITTLCRYVKPCDSAATIFTSGGRGGWGIPTSLTDVIHIARGIGSRRRELTPAPSFSFRLPSCSAVQDCTRSLNFDSYLTLIEFRSCSHLNHSALASLLLSSHQPISFAHCFHST